MLRISITILLAFPFAVLAQEIKCPKGYQPYASRCISQQMADYISCVEASGGNRQQIFEEVTEIGGRNSSTGIKASGSGTIVKGSGSLVLDSASEKALAKKWETRWYQNGMSECRKALDRPREKAIAREITKTRKSQEKVLKNQDEIKQQNLVVIKGQEEIKAALEGMKNIEKVKHSELKAKYPSGYCLFAIDHRDIIIPNGSILEGFDIDWNKAKVIENLNTHITFALPSFFDKSLGTKFSDNTLSIAKRIGTVTNGYQINGLTISAEILDIKGDNVIGLIGFKHEGIVF